MSRRFIGSRLGVVSALLAMGLLAPLASAQPLAEKTPADALLYVGWKGADSLGPAYDASHLKAVIDASNMPEILDTFLPALAQRIAREDRQAAMAMNTISSLGQAFFHHPSALYVGGLAFEKPGGEPMPRLAVLCDAGPDAPKLLAELQKTLKNAGGGPAPVNVSQTGAIVVLTVGSMPADFDDLLKGAGGKALAAEPGFKATMAQVGKDPVCAVYLNGPGLVAQIKQIVDRPEAPPPLKAMWPGVRDALGIDGLGGCAWTGGFDGKDWSTQAFLAAAAPRKGLLGMLPGPLSEQSLRCVPKTATLVGANRFDLAACLGGLRDAVLQVVPQMRDPVAQGTQQINQMLGFDMEKDLLASLGADWTFYCDPRIGGNGVAGFVLVNRLKDPAKAEQSLSKLEGFLNGFLAEQLQREKVTIAFRQQKAGDLTLHYLATPLVTPTWTIADGNLYFALFPQIVQSAAAFTASKQPTILDNPDFVALRQRLAGAHAADLCSVSFIDLPKTAPNGYAMWLFLSRYAGMADLFGVKSPLMLIPPLDKLLPELSPAGSVAWVDDAGLHAKSVSPFPGSESLGTDPVSSMSVAEPALLVSILLPSLSRARETANRVKDAANLRQIGMGCILYANDNNGKYPPDLGELLLQEDLTAQVFMNPSSNTAIPPELLGQPKGKALAQWVNEHGDYVYVGAGKNTNMPGEQIVAYDKFGGHGGAGVNVLFGDGHVEWMTIPAVQAQLDKQAHGGAKPAPLRGGGL